MLNILLKAKVKSVTCNWICYNLRKLFIYFKLESVDAYFHTFFNILIIAIYDNDGTTYKFYKYVVW